MNAVASHGLLVCFFVSWFKMTCSMEQSMAAERHNTVTIPKQSNRAQANEGIRYTANEYNDHHEPSLRYDTATTTTRELHRPKREANDCPTRMHCKPDGFYCGHELAQIGYKNTQPGYLYQCDANGNGIFFESCPTPEVNTSCLSVGFYVSFCACKQARICGHELMRRNLIPPGLDEHALYQCPSTPMSTHSQIHGLARIMTCANTCVSGSSLLANASMCTDNRPSEAGWTGCVRGDTYCGYKLIERKFTGLQTHALYECDGNAAKFVRRCLDGCLDTRPKATCATGRTAIPCYRAIATTTPAITTTTPAITTTTPAITSILTSSITEKYKNNDGSTRTHCKPNTHYCGHELAQMGYQNTKAHYLYLCDAESNGIFFESCNSPLDPVTCASNISVQSYCACTQDAICGHELRGRNFLFSTLDDHTLYQCTSRSTVSRIKTCALTCIRTSGDSVCSDDRASEGGWTSCDPGNIYCGYALTEKKFTGLEKHARYECDPNGVSKFVEKCLGGCIDIRPTAKCAAAGKATPAITTTTLPITTTTPPITTTTPPITTTTPPITTTTPPITTTTPPITTTTPPITTTTPPITTTTPPITTTTPPITTTTPPITTTTPPITTTTPLKLNCNKVQNTDGSPRTHCKADSFYCGHELAQMGYQNTRPSYLYQCEDDCYGSYYTSCSSRVDDPGSCANDIGKQSYCACTQDAICGHELRRRNYVFSNLNDHTLYRCVTRSSASPIKTCALTCIRSSAGSVCSDDRASEGGWTSCVPGNIYCGYALVEKKFRGLEMHGRYECDANGWAKPMPICLSGCVETRPNATCSAGRKARPPATAPAMRSTTPAITSTTSPNG